MPVKLSAARAITCNGDTPTTRKHTKSVYKSLGQRLRCLRLIACLARRIDPQGKVGAYTFFPSLIDRTTFASPPRLSTVETTWPRLCRIDQKATGAQRTRTRTNKCGLSEVTGTTPIHRLNNKDGPRAREDLCSDRIILLCTRVLARRLRRLLPRVSSVKNKQPFPQAHR